MRLLDRKTINQEKAQEKKREIDQGAILASKVDSLRRLRAEEEKKIAEFRDSTLRAVQAEIDQKMSERAGIKLELSHLMVAREELQKPLDEEWQKVMYRTAQLSEKELEAERMHAQAKNIVEACSKKETEAQTDKERAEGLRKRAEQHIKDTEALHTNAQDALALATSRLQEADMYKEAVHKELTVRETNVAIRERDAKNQAEGNVRKEAELHSKEVALVDREKMLERDIKRIAKR